MPNSITRQSSKLWVKLRLLVQWTPSNLNATLYSKWNVRPTLSAKVTASISGEFVHRNHNTDRLLQVRYPNANDYSARRRIVHLVAGFSCCTWSNGMVDRVLSAETLLLFTLAAVARVLLLLLLMFPGCRTERHAPCTNHRHHITGGRHREKN